MQKLFLVLLALIMVGCGSKRTTKTFNKKKYSNKVKTTKLEATSKVNVTNSTVLDYIDTYKWIAMENMKSHGIPASIKLAQGILESGSGTGTLSQKANNHFGIKCANNWGGESVSHTDDAPDECFRKYNSPLESFTDHSNFLVKRKHYSDLFLLDKSDYTAWAYGLKNAGYATDPKYPEKLISIIERYELHQYDNLVLGKDYVYKKPKKIKLKTKNSYTIKKGDTLYSISNKFNMTVNELKKVNKLRSNNIEIGQTLKVK